MINISAKRTCQVRSLNASIFASPFFLTTLLPFSYLPQYQFMTRTSPTHRYETGKKIGEALASSALQPEDPQHGSDSSSLMQMNHAVKTTPLQRDMLGPAAPPATGH